MLALLHVAPAQCAYKLIVTVVMYMLFQNSTLPEIKFAPKNDVFV